MSFNMYVPTRILFGLGAVKNCMNRSFRERKLL